MRAAVKAPSPWASPVALPSRTGQRLGSKLQVEVVRVLMGDVDS